jgi:hypothetical protein
LERIKFAGAANIGIGAYLDAKDLYNDMNH